MANIQLGGLSDHSIVSQQDDPFKKVFSAETVPPMLKAYYNNSKTVKSKQQEENTAYGMLDCGEPPYKMRYLAKLYETSSIHAGAVDAKVENIVGLGWTFNISPAAERLRTNADSRAKSDSDDTKRDSLEKKLER